MTKLWDTAKSVLKKNMTEVVYNTWITAMQLVSYDDNNIVFYVKDNETGLYKETIERRYLEQIKAIINDISGKNYNITIINDSDKNTSKPKEKKEDNVLRANLNPRYTFDTFVVGSGNRMAHAASLAVAENPAGAYNPLFLYGDVGLGKTHLMQSIAHFILDNSPQSKVLYVSTETFTNELINSIKTNTNEQFRNKYRDVDVLLIDDIQFIAKKESTQEEFFHTFNALHTANKQIIISSDRPPKEIQTLESRLRSRFEGGLIADIQPPDYETRMAILRKKTDSENLDIPDNVISFIAKSIISNIRELEGALTRIVAYAKLTGSEITPEFAQNSLKDIFSEKKETEITIPLIQEIVSSYYKISVADLKGPKKPKNIAYPRQIAMYLSRKLLDSSLPRIGEFFGGRDHTTVIHACTKIEKELEKDKELEKTLFELEKRIKGA